MPLSTKARPSSRWICSIRQPTTRGEETVDVVDELKVPAYIESGLDWLACEFEATGARDRRPTQGYRMTVTIAHSRRRPRQTTPDEEIARLP